MKRFWLPTFIIALISWVLGAYIFYYVPPKVGDTIAVSNVSYLLTFAFFALTTTLTLILYLILAAFVPKTRIIYQTSSLKGLFFRCLRRSFLFSITIVGLEIMHIASILTLINAALLIGIVVLVEIHFSSR